MVLNQVREEYSQGLQNLSGNVFVPFLLAVILLLVEAASGYTGWGMSWQNIMKAWQISGLDWLTLAGGISLLIIIGTLHFEDFKVVIQDSILYIIMIFVLLFFAFTGGPLAMIHIAISFFIFLTLPIQDKSFKTLLELTTLFCVIDYVGYGVLATLFRSNSNIFLLHYTLNPNLVFVIIQGLNYQSPGFFRGVLLLLITAMILSFIFLVVDTATYYGALQRASPQEIAQGVSHFYEGSFENFVSYFTSATHGFSQLFNMSSYNDPGTQEQTEEPQGLTLKALDQGDRPFITGNNIYGTAMLEARTLEKPIEAYVICYTEVEAQDDMAEDYIEYGKINGMTGPLKFTIISFSQHTVRCSFETLPPGDYEVVFNATFDFASEIRKKIYLMDRQRLMNDQINLENKGRESSSENVLIELYDITDTDPKPIYTSGPVMLGIGTDNLPIDIGKNEIRKSQFSVSAENDWSKGGKIASFNDIYLKIPETFSFSDPMQSCDLPVTLTNEQYEDNYKTYKMELDERFTNIRKDIGVSCIMDISSSSLEPVPVTVKYLKSYLEYTYVMQEEVDVEVEESPMADEELYDSNQLCCEVKYEAETKYYRVVNEEECDNYNTDESDSKLVDYEMCET